MIMGSQNGDLMNDMKALMGDLTGKATGRMKELSSGTPKTDPKPSAEAIGSQVLGRPRRYSQETFIADQKAWPESMRRSHKSFLGFRLAIELIVVELEGPVPRYPQ
jgi:hypothetical protein